MYSDKPWLKFYDDVPEFLDYPRVTMYEALAQTAQKYPERIAYDFLDYEYSFKMLILTNHADGKVWLHTGDIFTMSEEGFFSFKLRYKRMIKSSGMNVYPAQVEAILYQHPAVRDACIIGIPDPAQIERVKAFVVLKDLSKASQKIARLA